MDDKQGIQKIDRRRKNSEFVLALYLDDIVNHDGWGGLNSVGIWLNSDGCDQNLDIIDNESFPWYWVGEGSNKILNGRFS